jgi:hypothetical protein
MSQNRLFVQLTLRPRLPGVLPGYDGGYDFRVFLSCYEDDPDYVEGFVEGCLERIAEEEDESLAHPEDITAEQLLGIWQDL